MNTYLEKFFLALLFIIVVSVAYLLTKYTVDNYNYNLNKSYKVENNR